MDHMVTSIDLATEHSFGSCGEASISEPFSFWQSHTVIHVVGFLAIVYTVGGASTPCFT